VVAGVVAMVQVQAAESVLQEATLLEEVIDANSQSGPGATDNEEKLAEVAWAWKEAGDMIFDDWAGFTADWADNWWVKFNPICWSLYFLYVAVRVLCATLVLSGKWLHFLVAQDGPVNTEETPHERIARVWWIYPTDSSAILSILCGTLVFFSHLTEDEIEETRQDEMDKSALHWSLYMAVCITIVFGNYRGLMAMKNREPFLVKVFITMSVAWGVGLSLLLTVEVFYIAMYSSWTSQLFLIWALRLLIVLPMISAAEVYNQLWSLYDDPDYRNRQPLTVAQMGVLLGVVLVVGALLASSVTLSESSTWGQIPDY